MSAALRGCCRNTDVLARWGGDEFVVLTMGEIPTPESLEDQLLARLSKESTISLEVWASSLSVGTASLTADNQESLESLIKCADQDMYLRRARKRNHIG